MSVHCFREDSLGETLYSTPAHVLAATSVLTCIRKSKCAHLLAANNVEKEYASTLREKLCLHTEVVS